MTTMVGHGSRARRAGRVVAEVVAAGLLVVGCGSSATKGNGPTSTGPTSTGPTSTGPTSTGPTSTGPHSTGPHSTGAHSTGTGSTGTGSTGPTSTGPTSGGSPGHTSGTHGTGCPAHATGTVGGRERQAIWFRALGVTHEWPDKSASLVACSSSGLPVTFSLATVPAPSSCQLDPAGHPPHVSAWTVVATCTVVATQAGNARFAPAPPVQQPYRVTFTRITVSAHGPNPGAPVPLTAGTVPVTVTLTAHWPFTLDQVNLLALPDSSVCSAPAPLGPITSGAGHVVTLTFHVPLHAPGSCDLRVGAGGGETVALANTAEVQFAVGS